MTRETSHLLIGPCDPLEQSTSTALLIALLTTLLISPFFDCDDLVKALWKAVDESLRHSLIAVLSSSFDCGENAAVGRVGGRSGVCA